MCKVALILVTTPVFLVNVLGFWIVLRLLYVPAEYEAHEATTVYLQPMQRELHKPQTNWANPFVKSFPLYL